MKKLLLLALAVLATGVFAAEWYTKQDFVTDLKTHATSKDTTWNTYVVGTSGYIWNPIAKERGTFYDVGDFGLSYPMNIHGVSVYLDDADTNYTFSYKIYDKDGSTLLWQSDPIVSIAYDNDVYLDIPIMIQDDFWVAVVPDGAGYPRVFSGVELGTDPASTHSYLKQNDGTWKPFTDGTDHYEMFAYVLLSPYAGTDTLAPTLREISGTEVFMQRDMELSITVHEQNAVVSPMQAQYNIGAGWVDFTMTQLVKNSYVFTGTIPGQAGGTAGLVKFNLTDDQANSAWSSEYPINWSMDIPMFEEGFEGPVFPPDGWTLQTTGAGFTRGDLTDGGFIYDGVYSAVHWDDSGAQDDWLITPPLTLPADNACTFSFWQTVYWSFYYTFCEVSISTDMVNWTQIYVPPYIPNDPEAEIAQDAVWIPAKMSLGAWAGQTVYIGFHYTGDYSHQWYIDNVELLYDYEGPQIAQIKGNEALLPVVGAYLNNPLTLNLNITDLSGVKSVVGHYDIGGAVGDAVFSKAKGVEEIWTGSIPAQAAEAAGTINFTLTDIGDLTTETADYPIEFVADTGVAVIKYLIGNETFIYSDMNLELAFFEESAIASCKGYFSKDYYATPAYEFTLTPSKIHEYVYNGTIPYTAVNAGGLYEEVFFNGRVYFEITDSAGNTLTSEQFTVKWLDGQIEVQEDFEGDLSNWTVNGYWGIEEEPSISGTHSLTESVNRNYADNSVSYAMWANPMDWSGVKAASISFWVKYDLEAGFDYMYFDVSDNGGYNWIRLKTWNGVGVGWNKVQIPLDAVAGCSQVTFRFQMKADEGLNYNGMYIDDIELRSYNKDYGAPTIISDPFAPEFFEGAYDDYIDTIIVTDATGVNEVGVYYTVEGLAGEQYVQAVNTVDSLYQITIPKQEAGKLVSYRYWAEDTTEYKNADYSPYYEYLAGKHQIYDGGVVSFYTTCDPGDARAVRVSLPDSEPWQIAYALIRNYQDLDHFSAPMIFHLWNDNGGVPGTDIIEPFQILSACTPDQTHAMTRVDLREKTKDILLSGDFWIGFEATDDIVYTTMETPGTAYNRSFDGTAVVGGWSWAQASATNYHFRAVIGYYNGIESDEIVPVSTSLEQNYPNPFNPTTTISFNLAKDSKVSLVVYDVMGREVANLVDKDMASGSHKVSFDASRLVSGVYYYNLKAGDVNQTKKMMLIK